MPNYHKYLNNQGYLLHLDHLTPEEIKEIKRELTFEPKVFKAFQKMTKVSKFLTYKVSPNYIIVPRYYGIAKFGLPVKIKLPSGDDMHDNCQIVDPFVVRNYQIDAYERTRQQLLTHGGGILSVFCGWGKTFIAIFLAVQMHGKTLVAVGKESHVEQWKSDISRFTGGTARVGLIQQDKIDITDCDFVLAMIPSLSLKQYDAEIFQGFRFLIVDECHHVGSEVFSRILDKVCFRYTLGLSATPNRKDGLTPVFTNYLGPIFHVEKRKNRDDTLVIRLPLESHSQYYEEQYFGNGTKNTGKMILQLSEFSARNQLILELLRIIFQPDSIPTQRKILILSKSRNHLKQLFHLLQKAKLKYDNQLLTVGYYWGHNPNGEADNNTTCLAPIPKLQETGKGKARKCDIEFDLTQTQACLFGVKFPSCFCQYHQYLNPAFEKIQNEIISSDGNIDETQLSKYFRLCVKDNCFNYYLDVVGERQLCPVCQQEGETRNYDSPSNLLASLKLASKQKRNSKQKHREMLKESLECDIILGTNEIASEALSIDGLNTLISITPQQEVEQTVGRILRRQDTNLVNRPLIIDLIDRCGNFVNHSRVRKKIYQSEGFRIVDLPVLQLDESPLTKFNYTAFQQLVKNNSWETSSTIIPNNNSRDSSSDSRPENCSPAIKAKACLL